MKFLYNFGMSQDDAATERKALEIEHRTRLACIASAGEVPLNLLASTDIQIDAVDISNTQLSLAKLKMKAAVHLDPPEAAKFIGYRSGSADERARLYKELSSFLEDPEKRFWDKHPEIFEKGPIHNARYEKYLSRFNWIGVKILGRKKLLQLCEFDDVDMQKQYFDRYLASKRLKNLFKIVFHPKIFKNHGMDEKGLIHGGNRNMAEFFFSCFRNFCTATPANQNYFLQVAFFNRILFDEAIPEYLKEKGNARLRKSIKNLSFFNESISDLIRKKSIGYYDGFALSNVGDWMSPEEFSDLLRLIGSKAADGSRALLRYIHRLHPIPEELIGIISPDNEWGRKLGDADRYPFCSFLPFRISTTDNQDE